MEFFCTIQNSKQQSDGVIRSVIVKYAYPMKNDRRTKSSACGRRGNGLLPRISELENVRGKLELDLDLEASTFNSFRNRFRESHTMLKLLNWLIGSQRLPGVGS
jgi:hypothetical protein